MWATFKRILTSPIRSLNRLARIVTLLEEQNQLMRELHVALIGRPAMTPRTKLVEGGRRRTASDVSQRTPRTETQQWEAENRIRQDAASTPIPSFENGDPNPSTTANNPDERPAA